MKFLKMKDDLIFFLNGRRPQFFEKGRRSQNLKMKDDFNFVEIGRLAKFFENFNKLKITSMFFFKRKTASIYLRIEDSLIFFYLNST